MISTANVDEAFIDTLGSDILLRLETVKGQGTKALKPATSAQQTENLRGAVPGPSADGVMPKTLGSTTNDQVFTPITPCRVVDTRNLGGPIGPFATRNFFYFTSAASTNWNSLQGGVNGAAGTVCPGTVLSGFLPSSAVATITVTGQGGSGNLIVWQGTNPLASASTMSYPASGDTSSLATIPAGGRSGTGPGGTVEDFGVFVNAFTGTNVVVDIVGYYSAPAATALDQTIVVGTPDTCTNGNACAASAICTAGYTVTGGGFQNGGFAANNDVVYSGPNTFSGATGWLCQSQNASGSTQTLTCVAICARVPGH